MKATFLAQLEWPSVVSQYGSSAQKEWFQINSELDALKLELLRRGQIVPEERTSSLGGSVTTTAINEETQGPDVPRSDPDLAKRRAIIAQNRGLEAKGICNLLDTERVPLPVRLKEAGSWARGYNTPNYHHKIESIISKDRQKAKARRN